jgi:hypothetical protein
MIGCLLAERELGGDSLPLCVKPLLPLSVVAGSGKKMAFWSKVSCENAVDFEKALCMLGRLEALYAALALPGRLMRVLSPVV